MRKLTIAALIAVALTTTACAGPYYVAQPGVPIAVGSPTGYAVVPPAYYPPQTYYGYNTYNNGYVYGCQPVYQLVSVIEMNGSTSTRKVYAGCK